MTQTKTNLEGAVTFDAIWLAERFRKFRPDRASERLLDGDVWWILDTDEKVRDVHDHFGIVSFAMHREGSPGAGLSRFLDTRNHPPCKLDFAPRYTTDLDSALALADRLCHRWKSDRLGTLPGQTWQWVLNSTVSGLGPRQKPHRLAFAVTHNLVRLAASRQHDIELEDGE